MAALYVICDPYLQKLYKCDYLNQSSTSEIIMHIHDDLKSRGLYTSDILVTGKQPEKNIVSSGKMFIKRSLKLQVQEWN